MSTIRVERVRDLKNKKLIKKILEIEKEAFGPSGVDNYSLPVFVLFGAVYVLFVGEVLAGVCELMKSWEGKKALIYGFSIKEEFRGRGLGKFFLTEILRRIPREIKTLHLTVAEDNKAAIKIYKKAGFEPVSKEKDFFGDGKDRLILKKEL